VSDLISIDQTLSIPPELDGHEGDNRAPTVGKQISADNDLAAVGLWLAEFRDSPHTFRSYRKEALRLFTWSVQVRRKALSSLSREDCLAYGAFLADPPPAWCDESQPRRGPSRALFAGPLSAASCRHALGIVSGLFAYLVNAGYLAGNPWSLKRHRATGRHRPLIERYLDQGLWDFVLNSIESEPRRSGRDEQRYERDRWLMRFLYETALRAAEAAAARASDFVLRRGRWWLHVIGKGGVIDDVPVSGSLLEAYRRYRLFHGLTPTPSSTDTTPLILGIAGASADTLTPTAVYLITKQRFVRAAKMLESTDPEGAHTLRRASTHWLRHTAASHQADAGVDLRHVQRNLRHASLAVTSLYLHSDDDARHEETAGARGAKNHQPTN
jgi:integrase